MTRTVASTMPPAWHCGLAPARTAPPNSSRHAICDRSTRRHADCLSYGYSTKTQQKDPPSARAHARSTSRIHRFAARWTALHVAEGVKKPALRAGESSDSAKLWIQKKAARDAHFALSPRRRASATHPTAATRFRRVDEPHQRIPRPPRKDARKDAPPPPLLHDSASPTSTFG